MVQLSAPFLLRPVALEYRVSGRLDGSTPAPPVPLPPDPASPTTPDQFVRQDVVNLGLIDLTGGGPEGQFAGRFVKHIQILGPSNPDAGDNVAIAFNTVRQRTELEIPANANGIFSRNCIFVPQTAQLQLDGMAAGIDPVIVRVEIWQPQQLKDIPAIIEACCCLAASMNEFEQPNFVHALYSQASGARTIESVDPTEVFRGTTPTLAVSGDGFTEGDVFSVTRPLAGQNFAAGSISESLRVLNVEIVSNNLANVQISVPTGATLGDYDVSVAPDLGAQFKTTLSEAIEVFA